MSKRFKEIDFNEAIEITKEGGKVYVLDLEPVKPVIKTFSNVTISDAVKHDYLYVIVEECEDEK